jgi:hypothetical protein
MARAAHLLRELAYKADEVSVRRCGSSEGEHSPDSDTITDASGWARLIRLGELASWRVFVSE